MNSINKAYDYVLNMTEIGTWYECRRVLIFGRSVIEWRFRVIEEIMEEIKSEPLTPMYRGDTRYSYDRLKLVGSVVRGD